MILLDISIISELLRDTPAAQVIEWIDAQPLETLYLSATTVAALQAAVARLPSEERRAHVHAGLEKRLLPLFAGRILPFDQSCTKAYAEAITKVEKGGSEILPVDGYIAAIDRKSTRLNSSHVKISYAVFCLKKKKRKDNEYLPPERQ